MDFVTIKTFSYYNELSVIRSRLEFEGIVTFVPDELTIQTSPYYSNAMGGLRLQVKRSDLEQAQKILREAGLNDQNIQEQTTLQKLIEDQKRFRLLGNIHPFVLLLILIGLIVGVITTVLFFVTRPSSIEMLTQSNWCVIEVQYEGKSYLPKTEEFIKMTGPGICEESLSFDRKRISLPGFHSEGVSGSWIFSDDSLMISNANMFDYVYNGTYKVEFANGRLILTSSKTIIKCYSNHVSWSDKFF